MHKLRQKAELSHSGNIVWMRTFQIAQRMSNHALRMTLTAFGKNINTAANCGIALRIHTAVEPTSISQQNLLAQGIIINGSFIVRAGTIGIGVNHIAGMIGNNAIDHKFKAMKPQPWRMKAASGLFTESKIDRRRYGLRNNAYSQQ